MRKHLLVTILVLACAISAFAEISIIPTPVEMQISRGSFTLTDVSKIVCTEETMAEAPVEAYIMGDIGNDSNGVVLLKCL